MEKNVVEEVELVIEIEKTEDSPWYKWLFYENQTPEKELEF